MPSVLVFSGEEPESRCDVCISRARFSVRSNRRRNRYASFLHPSSGRNFVADCSSDQCCERRGNRIRSLCRARRFISVFRMGRSGTGSAEMRSKLRQSGRCWANDGVSDCQQVAVRRKFALQSAMFSAALEWFFPLRDWRVETDLWHHPRKYLVPAIMMLVAGGIIFFKAGIWHWLLLLLPEAAVFAGLPEGRQPACRK